MESNEPQSKEGILKKISGVIVTVIGIAVGNYSGMNLLIPVAGAFLCGWIMSKLLQPGSKPMIPALAVQAGHVLWFCLGLVLVNIESVLLDIGIMVVGLVWFIARPSLPPVVLLAIYQTVAFFINLLNFISADVGSSLHKGLLVHLILRVTAIILMFTGLRGIRRQVVSVQG